MNDKKIVFIICANNAQYYDECVRYLNDLIVPEGYETDLLCVQDAESMAQGYNAAMNASDAKYKVYLHQDAFIINKSFIVDFLDIFNKNTDIGLLGLIGGIGYADNEEYNLQYNVGCIGYYDGRSYVEKMLYQDKQKGYQEVDIVDGVVMVTQYDIEWREDILTGWDYCDISISYEMEKRGYKVVVPYQEVPWCFHDCGAEKLKNYKLYRDKIRYEYPKIFFGEIDNEKEINKNQIKSSLENAFNIINNMLSKGCLNEIETFADDMRENMPMDTRICEIINMMEIYSLEKATVEGKISEWLLINNWEQLYEYYKEIKFILLRLELGRDDERIEILAKLVENEKVSRDAIRKISFGLCHKTGNIFNKLIKQTYEKPLVSVIMSVYNGEMFVSETIESVLNQTYKNLEIIIVDDASNDNSRKIIDSYDDDRIKKIYLEKNHNICYASNTAFEMARGKYVALIGHDDVWDKDKIEKQISFMEEHPQYGVCFTWLDIIDENNRIQNNKWLWLYNRFTSNNNERKRWIRKLILGGNHFCAPSACVRKDVLDKVGYYKYGLVQLQDYDLWCRVLNETSVYILQEKLVLYRRFNDNEKNLSAINNKSLNRDRHETQYIIYTYISNMRDEDFAFVFKDYLKSKDSIAEREIKCEKAFILWNLQNCFAEQYFIDLLEDEKNRKLLEEKYHFTLGDFYEMNTSPMNFDDHMSDIVEKQKAIIERYKKMIKF